MATVDDENDKSAALTVGSKIGTTENNADHSVPAAVSNSVPHDSTHVATSLFREESSFPFGLDYLLDSQRNLKKLERR
jgi:hypothetical protein